MFPEVSLWINANPVLFYAIWLVTGFAIGLWAIKDGMSESPVGTLLFMTVGGFPMLVIALPFAILYGFFAGIVWILGIEPSQSDTHGV